MPFSGARAHLSAAAAGQHMHGFGGAADGLPIAVGDTLIAYVYLDPARVPTEIMIRWITDAQAQSPAASRWAYWSAGPSAHPLRNIAPDGNATWAGGLPAAGRWVRLEVPASRLSLEGKAIHGMAFYLQDGGATWDRAGKIATGHAAWIDDGTPKGSVLSAAFDVWTWSASPPPFSGLRAHESAVRAGLHEHGFIGPAGSGIAVDAGESMVCYVYLNVASPPRELMLSWYTDGSWEHRAYWGEDLIGAGRNDTASRWYVGPLPPRGQWIRLEVPASLVSLEGKSVTGMKFTLYDGSARFDYAGTGPGRVEDEFVGPLPSWKDVKAEYGAVGDGVADDTLAIQRALDDLRNYEVLYFPAGTYAITDTLYLGRPYIHHYEDPPANQHPVYAKGRAGIGIIGADPMTTTIHWASSRRTGIFRWDGVNARFVNGLPVPMLDVEGVGQSKFSRITWDGAGPAGNADIGIFQHNGSGDYFGTNLEHSDEVFRDLAYGIVGSLQAHVYAGAPETAEWTQGISETAVLRTQFLRCSQAGAFMGSFSSVNWWFRDCYFSECKMGISTDTKTSPSDGSGLWAPGELVGAGNFQVYTSLFRRSSAADLHHQNTSFFSFRGNTSVGSNRFFQGGVVTQNALTIQGNIILDPVQPDAIAISSSGPVMLVDNVVRSRPGNSGPALSLFTYASRDLGVMSVGNTYTVTPPVAATVAGADGAFPPGQPGLPALWYGSYDDRAGVAAAALEPWPVMSFPGPARKLARPEIVVANVAGEDMADAIQTAIDAADDPANTSYYRKHTIVKLLGGKGNGGNPEIYEVGSTLEIADGSDVQLVGAGELATVLRWSGDPGSAGPILRIEGSTAATLRDLTLEGDGVVTTSGHLTAASVTGLEVELADRAESRLAGDQLFIFRSYRNNLSSEGLDQAAIELRAFQHALGENATSVTIRGGPLLSSGSSAAAGRASIFGGASSYVPEAFDVLDNGHLLVTDTWCENHEYTTYMSSRGSGELTLSGDLVAVGSTDGFLPMVPQLQFESFRGKISLLNTILTARFGIEFVGDGSQTRSLINVGAGNFDPEEHLYYQPQFVFDDGATPARISILGSHVRSATLLHYLAPNSGPDDSASVRDLLTQLRSERSALPSSTWRSTAGASPAASRLEVHRVLVTQCNDGMIVAPAP